MSWHTSARAPMRGFTLTLATLAWLCASCSEETPGELPSAGKAARSAEREGEPAGHAAAASPGEAGASTNLYQSRALGARIRKPDAWVFLPGSSLPEDTAERVERLDALSELMGPRAQQALVAMAPDLEARPGAAPLVSVFARPASPDESERGMRMLLSAPLDRLILGRLLEYSRLVDFELLDEPVARVVGGHEGVMARFRYGSPASAGAEAAIEARLWLVRQGPVYWWIEQSSPAPPPLGLDAIFQSIIDGIELEPAIADPFGEVAQAPKLGGAPQQSEGGVEP